MSDAHSEPTALSMNEIAEFIRRLNSLTADEQNRLLSECPPDSLSAITGVLKGMAQSRHHSVNRATQNWMIEELLAGSSVAPEEMTTSHRNQEAGSTMAGLRGMQLTRHGPPGNRQAGHAPHLPDADARYRVGRTIGRGGMGEVLLAFDRHLRRDVAVKVLRSGLDLDPECEERFRREALLASRLQHPGIVPVYDFDAFSDGRRFIAMRLVTGETLSAQLVNRTSPSDDRGRFLQIFEDIAQTVAYAHSLGIVHRDLKPQNVMIGEFGEVQVMDWGLARLITPHDNVASSNQDSADTSVSPQDVALDDVEGDECIRTVAGQILGTPAYLSPEQPAGDPSRVDTRTDVFGLGAILCEILTGKPPYQGPETHELLQMAASADLQDCLLRLDECGGDKELVALCRRCLMAEPADRPATASVVAEAVEEYSAGVERRLQEEHQERVALQVRAVEYRKRLRVTRGLTMVSVLLIAVVSGGSWWYRTEQSAKHNARLLAEQELRHGIEDRLSRAAGLLQTRQWNSAELLIDESGEALDGLTASRVMRDDIERARRDLNVVRGLDDIRISKRSQFGPAGFDVDFANGPNGEYAQLYRAFGVNLIDGSVSEASRMIRTSDIRDELVAGLDDWAGHETDERILNRILTVARLADPHPVTDRIRDPAIRRDAEQLLMLMAEIDTAEASSSCLVNFSRLIQRTNPDEAIAFLRRAVMDHPTDFWMNLRLGRYLGDVGCLRAAIAIRPDHPVAWNALGVVLHREGRVQEAETSFRKAITLDPMFAWPLSNLAGLEVETGRDADAEQHYQAAIRCEPGDPSLYLSLAALFDENDRAADAEATLRLGLQRVSSESSLASALIIHLMRGGRAPEALPFADIVVADSSAGAAQLYNAACVFSVNSSDATERDRERWMESAISALQAAIDAGWNDFDHIKADPDLEPLRTQPQYLQLFEE